MKLTKSSRALRRATAFVLAAALTLSAPVATSASAASKKVPSLSVKKKTLYFNKAAKKSFTLKVKKNKVKLVKTKWTTSKKSVAKLSGKKKTKVKVTAKKKGTAKITAKVTYKAGSKKKTKKLVCKVTSKKAKAPVKTETPVATSSSTAAPTDAPTQVPTEVPTQAPTEVPTAEPTATAEPTQTPAAVKAKVSNISAIDPSEFSVTLSFANEAGEVKADMIKDAKLEMKKGNITVTASFKSLEENGTAIFTIDDTSALKPGNRNADGTYDVTSKSASLELPDKATTTYEEAIAALAVEGYVTKWNGTDSKYEPVEGATVTILNNGKTATTDAYGYYKIATNSGKKTMQVEKAGFVTQITPSNQVSVNRNSLTSENFVLATYDVSKVYLNIQALNSKNEGIVVEGATVVLKDKDGKKVFESELKTDTSGKAVIANWNGNISYSANNVKPADQNKAPFLVKDTEYTLEIEKKLSASNLNDVYKLYSGKVKIGGQYKHEVIAKVVKVAELPSMTITQKYNSDTEESLNADNTALYYTYQLFAESLKGTDGVAGALTEKVDTNGKLLKATGNLQKDKTVSSDLIPLINAFTSAPQAPNTTNNKATLPSGTYYVLVKSYGTDSTYATATATAYAVVQVDVTEGSAAKASIILTKGCTREITTNVGLRAIEKDTQGSVASGTALKVIEKTYAAAPAASYQLVTPNIDVDAANVLYQKMTGNVLVPVEDSRDANPTLLVKLTDNGTYSAKNEYTHILGAASYTLKTASNYSKADDWNFDANDIVNQQHTVDADSKWALAKIKIKVQAGDALEGKTVGTDAPKLKAIRILDSSDKEVAKHTYADADVVTGVGAATLAVGNEIEFVVDVAAMKLLDRGNYKVEATLVGCNPVKSAVTNVVGLERLESSITEKVVLSTSADKTTVSGSVMIQKLDKTSYKADDTTHLVQVVLLDSAGKIAGVGKTDASGNYSIVDKTSNGTQARLGTGSYTLVARGKTAETFVKTVTLTDKQTLTENLTMSDGATGTIKVKITNTNKNGITGARVRATDAYFVKDTTTKNEVWVSGTASGVGVDTSLVGLYDDESVNGTAGVVPEEREVKNLSEGTYNLEFYGSSSYVFVNQTETLSGIGDKKYPEYEFSPKQETSGGLIQLTVKHPGATQDNCVVVAKTQDGQIAAIKYRGQATETNPVTLGASDAPSTYTKLSVPSHQNYNIYVYNLSGNYVATTTKNVQGFAAEVTVAFDNATVD